MTLVHLRAGCASLYWPADRETGAAAGSGRIPTADFSGISGVVPGARPDAILRRVTSRVDGMAGVWLVKDAGGYLPLCNTLEDPWNNNAPGRSCIPAAQYSVALGQFPKWGATYQLLSVPGRTAILIHPGNTNLDTEGCILPGSSFTRMKGYMAISASKIAYEAIMQWANGAPQFTLLIDDAWGGTTAVVS